MVQRWDVFYRVKGKPLNVRVLPVMATCEWQAQAKFREQMVAMAGVKHAGKAEAVQVEKVIAVA